jgi:hypothetical protein
VDRQRHQLLPGAALPFDDHGARDRRDLLDLEQHFPDRFRLSDQARRLGETLAVENPPHRQIQFVRRHGLRVYVGESDGAETLSQLRILDVGQADHRGTVPQLVSYDLDIAGIAEVAGEDDEIGLEALDLAAQIVERGDHRRLVPRRLDHRVEPDRRLDVSERDQDFHLASRVWPVTLPLRTSQAC